MISYKRYQMTYAVQNNDKTHIPLVRFQKYTDSQFLLLKYDNDRTLADAPY